MDASPTQNRPLKAIDLFCGAGGSSYGARLAGVEIVAAFDVWEAAVATYNANFGEGKARHADIFELDPISLIAELGEIDLILASPECTNHSKASGKGRNALCERSRETALEIIRFANAFTPKWLIIENVVEMQEWPKHEELKEGLTELGYNLIELEINAQDFNIAQSRKRLFMLCSQFSEPAEFNYTPSEVRPARDIISNNGYSLNPLRTPGRARATLVKADFAIEQMQKMGRALEPFLIVYYGSAKGGGNGGWQNLDKPLRTITTLDRFGYVVPGPTREEDKMRMLQPEELKLAMGFGDDFKFAEGLARRDKIKLMGNGVCPPVMKAIIENLIKQPKVNESPGDS
jgi:DNA (cytosine-5)-methyltransferase 1